jgi:hypothetical protein
MRAMETGTSPRHDEVSVGPSLPAEAGKPPYRPKVAGKIGFWFGPLAGALVVAVNLRRMGHPDKARRTIVFTFLVAIPVAVIFILTPDPFGKLVGLAIEIGCLLIFPPLQESDFADWQAAHEGVSPSNGWHAIGWGVFGLLLYLALLVVVAVILPIGGVIGPH